MMRSVLCLLLLLAPVVAGDDPIKDFTKDFEALVAQVKSKDPAAREKALGELESRVAKLAEALKARPVVTQEIRSPIRLVIGSPFGSETMTGSFEENGRKGTYQLKSTDGKGRYRLEWSVDGKQQTAEGTLKELREKHKFLRATMAVMMPEFRLRLKDTPLVGVLVHPPTPELRHHLALPEGAGLVVHQVIPGSRAAKLGLKRHDVLLRVNGELIDARAQVKKLNEPRGEVEIVRRAKSVKISLKAE